MTSTTPRNGAPGFFARLASGSPSSPRAWGLLPRAAAAFGARPGEGKALFWSFLYFFLLLSGYYLIRPLRDAMGIAGGEKALPWLFSATFVAMLVVVPIHALAVASLSRQKLVHVVHRFFGANLLLFLALVLGGVPRVLVGKVFFVWTGVYNLFVVSVFWSFLVDVFTNEQGKRLFGVVSAGGSLGAIVGPLVTTQIAKRLGEGRIFWLLALSALSLELCLVCARRIAASAPKEKESPGQPEGAPVGGSVFAGMRIVATNPYLTGMALAMLSLTMTNTFLFMQKAALVRGLSADTAAQTALFAWNDAAVNVLSATLSLFVTGRLIAWMGLASALSVLPVLTGAGFLALSFAPSLALVALLEGLRRAAQYAIERPAREVLYTVVDREAKYKAKAFIDTVMFRGGDASGSWAHTALASAGLGTPSIALVVAPLSAIWLAICLALARKERALSTPREAAPVLVPEKP